MTAPKFVQLIRQIIPPGGTEHNGKPARLKSKVKKALDKAAIPSETIRGVGRRIGDYALVYKEENGRLFASFTEYDQKLLPSPSKKKRGGKAKVQPILTGKHHTTTDMTVDDFSKAVVDKFPEDWEEVPINACRWISTDMRFLLNTGHTVESAVLHIKGIVNQYLGHLPIVNYAIIILPDGVLVGVGPAS